MPANKIHVLGFEIANLIAAGEVVDRPASVIKELLENAVDSGATVITAEIQHGGAAYIRVTDNGCGIDFDDLPTAILRHATSKIKSASDLECIGTLGFRGEALAATAAVSKLRIISRPHESELGGLLLAEGGEIFEHTETGCSAGTTVIVEELFYNVPARRKFLKKDASETAAVCSIVERVALSRPDISFRLICDGIMKLRTEGNGDLRGAIYSVLGRDFTLRTIPVDYKSSVSVYGYIGMPDTARATRNAQIFFINGRYIRSKTIQAAVEQAYNTFIPQDKFPSCVLSLTISPSSVDFNVHPAKLEVKFSNEKLIFEAVYYAVKPALERNMTTAEIKLPGDGADNKSQIPSASSYLRQAERVASAFVPIRDGKSASEAIPLPYANFKSSVSSVNKKTNTNTNTNILKKDAPFDSSTDEKPILGGVTPLKINSSYTLKNSIGALAEPAGDGDFPGVSRDIEKNNAGNIAKSDLKGLQIESGGTNAPEYRIIGEVFDCYIFVEFASKLILIDKHAAHERILFERMRSNMRRANKDAPSQLLMLPIELRLTAEEAAGVLGYENEIKSAGFDFTMNGTSASVTALPNNFPVDSVSDIFETFGAELTSSADEARDMIFERALFTCACKAAIKGGRIYGDEHIKWLCDELFSLPDIKYCPHGRPVALELTHSQLDRHFKRTQ